MTMPRKAGVKKIDFASAPRAVLAGKYVQAHIDKWNSYKKDMMIVGKVHFEQFVDYAEALAGDGIVSANNYLSTCVNYEVDLDNVQDCPFFERRYGRLRKNVKKFMEEFDPTSARVLVLSTTPPESTPPGSPGGGVLRL